jgi:hypothetical protein
VDGLIFIGFGVSGRKFLVRMLGCPHPRHELVEQRGGPEVDEPGEHVGEIGLRIGAVQYASLGTRSDS